MNPTDEIPIGPKWSEGLVSPALDIAQTTDSPLLVLAGPGTGKTFTMMRRVARLLEEGVVPRRILVCTFTRTAATDLTNSLIALGVDGGDEVRAATIHAFCFGLLSKSTVMEITGRVPRPLLQFEERFLVNDLCGGGFGGIRDCGKRLKAFDAAWARLQSDEPGWPQDPVDRAFHQQLMAWLRFYGAMLIGELVPEALSFLRNNPAARVELGLEHVLVDEYQDLNRADQVLIDQIADSAALTVIGDENQSIYSFRYAHPEGITEFEDYHPETHDEQLIDCRRSPRRVVEISNALIANNQNRADRPIRPFPGNPDGEVYLVQWQSMEEESRGLAEYIRQQIAGGDVRPGQVLVLAPRRQFGYAIRDELNDAGVPTLSFFNEEALDGNPADINGSQAQQAFCQLTLLAKPSDWPAIRCWCGFGANNLNKAGFARIREHCENNGASLRDTLEQLAEGEIKIPYSEGVIERYRGLQQRLVELNGLNGTALVNEVFPEGEDWAAPMRTIADQMDGDDFDAQQLYNRLLSGITQPELPTDVDYVRVMSLHKSKGLTADLVVVAGCIEGLLPAIDTDLSHAEQDRMLEEQRRLFYVALTRTRRILVLSSVTSLPRNVAHRMRARVRRGDVTHAATITSRFINELGETCPAVVLGQEIIGRG